MGIEKILTESNTPEGETYKRRGDLEVMAQSELWEERGIRAGILHGLIVGDPRAHKVEPDSKELHGLPLDVRNISLRFGESQTSLTLRSSKEDGLFGFTVTLVIFVDESAMSETVSSAPMSPPERIIHGSTSSGRYDGELAKPDANFYDMAEAIDDILILDALCAELWAQQEGL